MTTAGNPRRSFHQEIEKLQDDVTTLATLAQEAIDRAVKSLKYKDLDLAKQVIEGDDALDSLAIELENRCFSLLALQQPMASDLRTIGSALRWLPISSALGITRWISPRQRSDYLGRCTSNLS